MGMRNLAVAGSLLVAGLSVHQIGFAEANSNAACTATGFNIVLTGFTGTHEIAWSVNGGRSGSARVNGSGVVFVDTPERAANSTVSGVVSWPKWVRSGGRWVTDGRVRAPFTTRVRCLQVEPPLVTPVAPEPTPPAVVAPPVGPTRPASPAKPRKPKLTVKRVLRRTKALPCRSWLVKPRNGVVGRVPSRGQVRVNRTGNRWYGFRDYWVIRTTQVRSGSRVVRTRHQFRFVAGRYCGPVNPRTAG